ncbi:hypothetical protein [Bacillus sp. CECT 9360]|uniref:hypothetical protein n=1 Tax=Bacillus sp. CECT 9360 TaxID=2845821 RepID=UPI001E2FCE4E|nr:hypothetical protein [Bacillus sp. CECT 9360]CAH0345599.1 hypothetical protein BCI9360_01891 [Bacillus sp. CECT 9360]
MIIKDCRGYELEKAQSNTPEDFFNQSEVTYIEDGEEKTLHVLYVRYFDEFAKEFTPYSANPLFAAGGKEIYLYDIAAIVCLLKNPDFRTRKRVYINTIKEFASYFEGVNFEKLPEVFETLGQKKEYKFTKDSEFII